MRRIVFGLLFCAALLGPMGATPVDARSGASVWVNKDAFTKACIGVTDNYPTLSYNQAISWLSVMGYTSGQYVIGHGFTRSAFLAGLAPAYAVYIHSHGDVYNSSSIRAAFLQDPPSGCNSYTRDYISAAQVQANLVPPIEIVIMSTCYLGAASQPHTGRANYMPEAFGIAKTQTTGTYKFYMGYVYETWDSEQYKFEGRFYSWMSQHPGSTLSAGWTYAVSLGGYAGVDSANPFLSAWYGDTDFAP
jgi:hypothetical protein